MHLHQSKVAHHSIARQPGPALLLMGEVSLQEEHPRVGGDLSMTHKERGEKREIKQQQQKKGDMYGVLRRVRSLF